LDLALAYSRLESAKITSKRMILLKNLTRKEIASNNALLLQAVARMIALLGSQPNAFSLNFKDISMRNTCDYPQNIAKIVASKYIANAAKLMWRLFAAMGK